MSKRYAYWVRPDGKPYRGTDGKYAPTSLLEELGRITTINTDGNISWSGLEMLMYRPAILANIAILDKNGHELHHRDTAQLAWQALTSIIKNRGGGHPVEPSEFIAEVNKKAAAHFRKPIKEFILISSLSIKQFPTRRMRVLGCEIAGLVRRGNRYPCPDSAKLLATHSLPAQDISSSRYMTVKVKTKGRTDNEAVNDALDALNYLRGLWTLFATYGSHTIHIGGPVRNPVDAIRLGRIHTLHWPNGENVNDSYWYEQDSGADIKLFVPKRGWGKIEENRRWACRKIHYLPYGREVAQLVIRYANALDHNNLDLTCLQMWSILEKITDTVGASYDMTIKRAIWPYLDPQIIKQMLQYIRLARNQYVHAAKSSDNRDQALYTMKAVIDPMLLRLIRNDFNMRSLKEYAEFMDHPTNLSELKRRHKVLSIAVDTRTRWERKAKKK